MSSLVVQADGKLVGADASGLVRLDASGRLDPTFGTGGVAEGLASGIISDLALQSDGILLVGHAATGGFASDFGVGRVGSTGTLDRSFGTNGTAQVDGGHDYLAAIAVDSAGRIVSTGAMNPQSGCLVGVTRHLPNGQLDTSFGDQDKVFITPGGYGPPRGVDVVLQGDDKPVVLVRSDTFVHGTQTLNSFLVRLRVDGGPDPTFGDGGFRIAARAELNPYSLAAPPTVAGW